MKVLFFVDDFKGGAGNVVQIIGSELKLRGYDVTICCVGGITSGRHSLNGIEVIRIIRKLPGKLNYLSNIAKIHRVIQRVSPDCIISFLFGVSALVACAIKKGKYQFIVSERSDPRALKPHGIFTYLTRRAYDKASSIVILFRAFDCIGDELYKSKCQVIPNPVLTPPTCRDRISNPDLITFVTIANDSPPKGLDLLLYAFSKARSINPSIRLRLYGSNDGTHLQGIIDELGLIDSVELMGYTNDIYRALNDADVYIMPSRHEGFPNSLCEAMSTGMSCIAFKCHEGMEELIEHNVNGILVEKENTEELAKALNKISFDMELMIKLGLNARAAMDKYNVKRVVDMWEELIHKKEK